MWMVVAFIGRLTAQVSWLGLRVGGHPALSLRSLNEPRELLQWLCSWWHHHKHYHCYYLLLLDRITHTAYVDAVCCYQLSSMVCHSVSLSHQWALQKWLNQSRCHLGWWLGWSEGSTSSIVFAGGANVPTWAGTLAPPVEYDWTVHLWRRCGLMSNYFDHLSHREILIIVMKNLASSHLWDFSLAKLRSRFVLQV